MDIETGFGSGPDNSPRLFAWAQAHPKEFAEIQARHHMRNLDTSSGAGMHDWGHFEWTPTAVASNRSTIDDCDRRATHKVEGNGTLTANINAPPSTHVSVAGGGIFKRIRVNRQVQMPKAAPGPAPTGNDLAAG